MLKIDLSKMIKYYREKEFFSQSVLAQILKESLVNVDLWENSHFEPTIRCTRETNILFKKAKMAEE